MKIILKRSVVTVALFLICIVTVAQGYSVRLNRNINLRFAPRLSGNIVETAPAGTVLQVVGEAGRWLRVQRNGNEVWMADWVDYSRIEDTPSTTQSFDVDNCCFVDRQCSSDADWTNGFWDFQNSQCAAPTQSQVTLWQVLRVIDGDTIDVLIDGKNTRIRYLQMNTPERYEPCYRKATQANANLVAGKTVRLVADRENADRYDRLLRFVYVDEVLVNRALVEDGYAEVVLYPPNDARFEEFRSLEAEAAQAGRGCHPTGIFDDGSQTR